MEYVPPYGSTDANAGYEDINQATATEGSPVPAAAIEHPMREIMAVINAAGLAPSSENLSQLLEAIQILILAGSATLYTMLTANATYYVSPSGNDTTGDGSVGAPWATPAKAVAWIQTHVNTARYTVTISCADGTYTSPISISGPFLGGGEVILQGNTATPSNCILSTTSDCIRATDGAKLQVKGFKLTCSAAGCGGLVAIDGGGIYVSGNMEFAAVGSGASHVMSYSAGVIYLGTSYKISASGYSHAYSDHGDVRAAAGITITLTNTPAWTEGFVCGICNANFRFTGVSFSGSATGPRYGIHSCTTVAVSGAGTSFFPGDATGVSDSNAYYS